MFSEFTPRANDPDLVARWQAAGYYTDETLGAKLAAGLDRQARLPFRVFSQTRPFHGTIGDAANCAFRFAAALRAAGLRRGDVVAAQLPNWLEAPVVLWGAQLAGVVVAPVVHTYGRKELGYVLRNTSARVLVTADRFGTTDYLEAVPEWRRQFETLETIAVVGDQRCDGAIAFDDLIDVEPLSAPVPTDADAPTVVGFTSGTTADPKGVVHTHRSFLSELQHAVCFRSEEQYPAITASPASHITGMLAVFSPMTTGDAIHLVDRWDPTAVLELLRREKLSAGGGATIFLTSLLDAASWQASDVEFVSHFGCGGAPIAPVVADRCEEWGIVLSRAYGSTEHPSITHGGWSDDDRRRATTDGRALPQVEMRIVDEDGHDVSTGTSGEIISRGPDLFAGYSVPALTAEAFTDDGWFRTGDVGRVDDDGYLTITDRVKDIIIRNGVNVSAAELEDVLTKMPGVLEAAAVAAPDARTGEHVCAFLRLASDATLPDLSTVQEAFARAGVGKQKWPEEIRAVDEFERTASGKVKKFVLRAALRREAGV